MHSFFRAALLGATAAALAGCMPVDESTGGWLDLDAVTAGAVATSDAADDASAPSAVLADGQEPEDADAAAAPITSEISMQVGGSVEGQGEYRLYELGPAQAGDEVLLSVGRASEGPFVVVLFDEDHHLLYRSYVAARNELRHVLRHDARPLKLGVMTPLAGGGGAFSIDVRSERGVGVPPPRRQVVWLNFGGASNVSVHRNAPISFGPFDGAQLGTEYVGYTQEVKDSIVQAMRDDYEPFNVTLVTSDEAPMPQGEVSVVHFGGSLQGLLGLADQVDSYNEHASEAAIVYTENFSIYWTMKLTPEEMGVMIANVGSHELGHLLGLYHTQTHVDVMDTTGSAWDLAGAQYFGVGELEASVFATGFEDSPRLLLDAVGPNPDAPKDADGLKSLKRLQRVWLRKAIGADLGQSCGTCLHLDE